MLSYRSLGTPSDLLLFATSHPPTPHPYPFQPVGPHTDIRHHTRLRASHDALTAADAHGQPQCRF